MEETNALAPQDDQELLLKAYKAIINFYDIQVDLPGIISAIPHDPDIHDEAFLTELSHKLGMEIKKISEPFEKIYSANCASFIPLQDNSACFLPDAATSGRFIISDQENTKDIDALKEQYKGYFYLLAPKEEYKKLDLSHMYKTHVFDWFWKPITSFWKQYSEVLLCTIFINFLALSVPLYTLNIYDRVVINFVEDTLIVLTIGVMCALIFDFIFKTLRSYVLEKVSVEVSNEYDVLLMERMLKIRDVDFHLTTGEKANLFRELHSIKDLYASKLAPTFIDVPFFFLFTYVIYKLAPPLAIIPLLTAGLVFALNYSAHKIIARYTANQFARAQSKSAFLIEMLNGLSTIRVLGADGPKLFKWKRTSKNASQAASLSNLIATTISNLSALITQLAQIGIIFFGAYLIHDGTLTTGGLVACSIIYGRSIAPVISIANVLARLKETTDVLKVIDRIFQIEHQDSSAKDSKAEKGPFKGRIEIKDLIYQYPKQAHPSLYKINTLIKPGDHVGILGKTGAGKTTLTQMIAGLISPNEGGIYLDNYSYDAIAQTELRRRIGYVPQDGFFFAGSLRENITMGDNSISESALERAIHMSGLDLVLEQTSEGIDMDVGEGGKRLSGGQRQAISLARVFCREPNLILFDEPTNGMDHALEARVKQNLAQFIQDKTFIMVTHRTTLLPLVTRLIVMDHSRIIADGGRDEIIKKLS